MYLVLRKYLLYACLALLGPALLSPAPAGAVGDGVEMHRLRIVNRKDGAVELSLDHGVTWLKAGTVLSPAVANNVASFSAGRWAQSGRVAATATHSMHIKVGQVPAGLSDAFARAALVSVVPRDFAALSDWVMVRQEADSCIVTDIAAGTSIFRSLSPFVGNRVYLEKQSRLYLLPDLYRPGPGDTLVIIVEVPRTYPREIVFENRPGGEVRAVYADGATEALARVAGPVIGTGRFEGTSWAGPGRVASNHPGVITVSTAPFAQPVTFAAELREMAMESRGGFQIVPLDHARASALEGTQWMTLVPLSGNHPPLEGSLPLFGGYISLSYWSLRPDLSAEVQARLDDGPWENLPQIVGKVDNAFTPEYLNAYYEARGRPRQISRGLTHIRILLPDFNGPLTREQVQAMLNEVRPSAGGSAGAGQAVVSVGDDHD